MSRLLGLRARLRDLLWRRDAESRANEEIQFHLEMEMEKRLGQGLTESEARRRALAAFGGVEVHKEAMRDARRFPFFDVLHQDARYAIRSLRRQPSFTSIAVVTLALGIGTATTMFSVLNGVMLRDTRVAHIDNVSVMWTSPVERPTEHLPLTYADLSEYGRTSRVYSALAGTNFQGVVDIVAVDGSRAIPVGAAWVTGNFFEVLGVPPQRGRVITPADDQPGAAPALLISDRLWRAQFASDAAIVGRSIRIGATSYTVVGVLPSGFDFPRHADIWIPVLQAFPRTRDVNTDAPDVMMFDAVARLRAGQSFDAARQEMNTFLQRTDAQRSAAARKVLATITPLGNRLHGDVRGTLVAASTAVSLLLLTACINVASLLLMRGALRTQELVVRRAIGAGRGRLVRLLMTEASVIALAGGTLGVLLAVFATPLVASLAPPDIPRRELITIDRSALYVALATTALATLVCGVVPALLAARGDLSQWLRGGRTISGSNRQSQWLRRALVVGQIAMSVMVLVGAGLLLRSLYNRQQVDMGFNDRDALIVETMLSAEGAPTRPEQLTIQQAMLARVATVPGVVAVSALPKPPFAGERGWSAMFSAEGQSVETAADNPLSSLEVVSSDFFRALEIPVLRGRAFSDEDREGSAPVVVVSESVARRAWPDGGAVGQRLKLGSADRPGRWMTVVGVTPDTRYRDLATASPTLYLPSSQFAGPVPLTFVVRLRPGAGDLRAAVHRALTATSASVMIVSSATLTERRATPLARPQFGAALLSAFAVMTLVLSLVGIYGVIAASVRERQRELGIRLALGESPSSIRALIMRRGVQLAVAGIAIGVLAALGGSRVLGALLYGISAADPLTYVSIVVVVLSASLLASGIPAWRAGRVDPSHILRDG